MQPPPQTQAFISAEGRYHLLEDIYLSEALQPNGTMGTSISLVTVKFKDSKPKLKESPNISSELIETLDTEATANLNNSNNNTSISSGSGIVNTNKEYLTSILDKEGFSLFTPSLKKKSKASVAKTNSSLVQKIIQHENLVSILLSRTMEHTYAFYNVGKAFYWVDIQLPHEPLSQIIFTKSYPTCHDVNKLTRSGEQLDVVIGLSSGDVIWFDPLSSKYSRINKQGIINNSSVTSIKWVPGSETLVLVGHSDGSLIVYDKDKDDQSFIPNSPTPNSIVCITKPSLKLTAKYNPQIHWQISTKPISAFAFSPDFSLLAVVSLDGGLRIIDYHEEILTDIFTSYFGGMTCVCWSPDRKYILTGGQDDLITIWSYPDQKIIARCQGHNAWVTGVAFDFWKCDEENYRFGSVGEDSQLLLWDFSLRALPKVKGRVRRGSQSIHSVHSTVGVKDADTIGPVLHPLKSRNQVMMLKPLMAQSVHQDPLCSIVFREEAIITTCKKGHIKIWKRPMAKIGLS
ncbi:WD40 repeat-like protein [Neoconidiobolus thromboides FSU 785]|nr:WD40 repeat-like protein [Neoconidiobolus thromboides FSU 785]